MTKLFPAVAAIALLSLSARAIEPMTAGRLELELSKLDTLGSVLYVAAHPDDENTNLIAYLANGEKVHTTYLSLTRGDGGQNLLGTDLGEKLGLIRTQELLAARRIDGGEQRFTRANDFGFSKTPEETLKIWGKQEILGDLVWTIRLTRPDVIITRFPMEEGFTHGHHTASTWLAKEAFTAAADPTAFPEQLKSVQPWAAKRIIWNTSSWYYSQRGIDFETAGLLNEDVGVFNPLLGKSYPEIAALSRTSHKTQGFGATPVLGKSIDYFQPLDGDSTTDSIFAGINTTWKRVPDSSAVQAAIEKAVVAYSPSDPSRCVPDLIAAHRALSALPEQFWKSVKLYDLEKVIAACIGLDVESISKVPSVVAGGAVEVSLNAVQRSNFEVTLAFSRAGTLLGDPQKMIANQLYQSAEKFGLPVGLENSQPYWLTQPHELGSYVVSNPLQIGTPENPPVLPIGVRLTVSGYELNYLIPTTYNFNDPVRGEVKEPLVVTPPVMVNLSEPIQIFADSTPRKFTARIIAKSDISNGKLRFVTLDGWTTEPETIDFNLKAGGEMSVEANLIPPATAGQSALKAELQVGGKTYHRGFERLEYNHIPAQTLFPVAEASLVSLDVKKAGARIGYIPGAGDEIPEALRRMGYVVDSLTEQDMNQEILSRYDAVVLGIRVLNTNPRIGFYFPALFEYADAGGTVVLQYNTNAGLKTGNFSPYPLTLSRDRVTEETAEMRVLAPDHPVMNFPNKITAADFDGWVQERGLYFPSQWDPAFTPIFSANDAGEKPLDGGLLIARHGRGWFVSTGLSWFRELPAGVPGAYRIFANIVSLSHAP